MQADQETNKETNVCPRAFTLRATGSWAATVFGESATAAEAAEAILGPYYRLRTIFSHRVKPEGERFAATRQPDDGGGPQGRDVDSKRCLSATAAKNMRGGMSQPRPNIT